MACSVGSARSNPRMPVIDWHRVTTWVGLDEVVNAYMAMGKRVLMNFRFIRWGVTARCDGWVQMIGRLEYQCWTDKASDEQPSRAVVVASQMLRFATTLLRRRPCGCLALDDESRRRDRSGTARQPHSGQNLACSHQAIRGNARRKEHRIRRWRIRCDRLGVGSR